MWFSWCKGYILGRRTSVILHWVSEILILLRNILCYGLSVLYCGLKKQHKNCVSWLSFSFSFSTFLTIPWAYHLGMYFVFADLILSRHYIWKYVILKYSCFNQRTQTIVRSIYQRKLKWSYESLASFSLENFVNRGIILEIPIFQSDFEESFNFKVENLEF